MNAQLSRIAHGRSGDKGNHANIALIAYTPAGYEWLKQTLTADGLREILDLPTPVERFEAPNVLGLNFLLYDVLAGGASQSLRIDTQGKTLATKVLSMWFDIPEVLLEGEKA